jgi:hypothetical protein
MLKFICLSSALATCMLGLGVAGSSAATWTIQTTPNATGAEHSALYDISCKSGATSPCVSVGKQTQSGGKTATYAQAWNGTSWTNISSATPEGATAAELQSIDCSLFLETLFCFAAGSHTSSGVTKNLIVVGGSTGLTSVQTTPNPEGASETALKGISCRSACVGVGYSVKSGKKTAFAVKLASESKWEIQSLPEPEGATSSELHGVDCPASNYCMAVGSYTVSGGAQWAWSAVYNGTSWSLMTVAKPTESKGSILLDVSCGSSSLCRSVGGYKNSSNIQVSLAEVWSGGVAWSHESSKNPIGSVNTVFQGISCLVVTSCVAVGDWNNSKMWQPMAQVLTPSFWELDTTPTPAGATFSLLEGVACGAGAACLASGWYTDSGGKNKTLGEKR